MIKAYLRGEQENWDLHLGCLAAAYRATPHESTGLTPNLVMLGREVRLPTELIYGGKANMYNFDSYGEYVDNLRSRMQEAHDIARKNLKSSTVRQETIYDSKLHLNSFKPGDTVWVENEMNKPGSCQKLQNAYRGPCVITCKMNDLTYKVMLQDHKEKVIHHNKLKPCLLDKYPAWITRIKSGFQT